MYTGKIRPSSIYKEYPAADTCAQLSGDLPKIISALDQVVGLVEKVEANLDTIQASTQSDEGFLGVLKRPRQVSALRLAIVTLRSYAAELDMYLKQKRKLGDLRQGVAAPVLINIANDTDALTQTVDNALLYPPTSVARRSTILASVRTRVINLVKYVAILKSLFGELRAGLLLEHRSAQQRPKSAKPPALFDEGPDIYSVLEGFKNRGWNVSLRQNDEDGDEDLDGYGLSVALLDRVKKPVAELLPADAALGVVRFPVIVRVRTKLSERMITKCVDPKVGYSLYYVFGGYLTVDNAIAVGINKDLMSVYDSKGKPTVDTDKFVALLPYATNKFPEWIEPLKHVRPVHPAKLAGSHYYMLFMPQGTIGASRHAISDWSFLSY